MAAAKRPGISHFGALRKVDPAKWEREVRRAMKACDGRIPEAAERLGVAPRTLYLWLEEAVFAEVPRAPTGVHRSK